MQISPIINTKNPTYYELYEGREKLIEAQKAIYKNLSKYDASILVDFIKDEMIIFPEPIVRMMERLGATGLVSGEYQQTQTALCIHEDGYRRWGGLNVGTIIGLPPKGGAYDLFTPSLSNVVMGFDGDFFPFATDGMGPHYYCISLKPDTYGRVYSIIMYDYDYLDEETIPTPDYIYPNIDALLDDLGPFQEDPNYYKIDESYIPESK